MILTTSASDFLNGLARTFAPRRQELLERRRVRQQVIDAGIHQRAQFRRRIVTRQLAQQTCRELQRAQGRDRFVLSAEIFEQMLSIDHFPEFLTLAAYNR